MLPAVALLAVLSAVPTLDDVLAAEKDGDDKRALLLAKQVAAREPGWHLARLEAGRLRLKLGVELGAAEVDLEVARSRAPENPRVHYYWALLSLERGDLEQAQSFLERAVLLRSSYAEARARLAGLCFTGERWDCAEKHYREIVRLDPSPGNWVQLAASLEGQARLTEAEVLYKSVLLQNPAHPGALRKLAALYDRTGRSDLASGLRGEKQPKKMRPLKKSRR